MKEGMLLIMEDVCVQALSKPWQTPHTTIQCCEQDA